MSPPRVPAEPAWSLSRAGSTLAAHGLIPSRDEDGVGIGDGVADGNTDGDGPITGAVAAGPGWPVLGLPLRNARLTPNAPPTPRTTIAAAMVAPTRGPTRKPD